jgi:hypothetical protein
MFQDLGASSLNFTMAKGTGFQRKFFSADCERACRGKAPTAEKRMATAADNFFVLND